MEVLEKRQKILDILVQIERELQKHPETIPDHVFQTLEAFCKMIYVWKTSGQTGGWTKPLDYFVPEDGKLVEGRFRDFDVQGQTGGANIQDDQFGKDFKELQKNLNAIGVQWREIMSALGVVTTNTIEKAIESAKDYLPEETPSLKEIQSKPSAQKQMSSTILSFFSTLIESLRIWVAYSSIDSITYRVLLSFSQTLLDTVRGNIRQALISSLGLFGEHGYYMSILTRFVINIIEMISPELPKQIEMDIYKNIKTMTAAILLWGYYTFAPLTLKYNINILFDEVKKIANQEEISLDSLASKIKQQAKEEDISLPDLPLDAMPSYEDILLLGSLLQNTEIACLPSFKKLIYPLRSVFTLRLTLDLLNVPTGQAEIEDLCSHKKNTTRKSQKGGRKRKTRKAITF